MFSDSFESPLVMMTSFLLLGVSLLVGYVLLRTLMVKRRREAKDIEAELEAFAREARERNRSITDPSRGSGLEGPGYSESEARAVRSALAREAVERASASPGDSDSGVPPPSR